MNNIYKGTVLKPQGQQLSESSVSQSVSQSAVLFAFTEFGELMAMDQTDIQIGR